MSDAISALPGAAFEGAVRVEESGLQGMITLRGDFGTAKLKKAVKDTVGVAIPATREIAQKDGRGAAWMSPDELLLLLPYADVTDALGKIDKALSGTHHLAVNVSDARAMFRLHGATVREVMAKLVPVDMAPGAFAPGQIRRTRMAQIPAAFWMTDEDTVHVVCFRSVAQYAFDLLKDAARSEGRMGLFD
ncbi:sarcosine oxidase subunit gamma [Roseovarius aestuariivivens]|uniref:sarcosine oxidase subunit gamma n=1 Tax=Roseovarius aestuariivivens TaxID=1888910 RepID=UPI00108091A9|nr:sarcosine oxidase subunit gamma family protein [Roseovarius aestuariivivens]